MPFLLSHSFAGSVLSSVPFEKSVPKRVWWLGALCGAIPDFDYAWNLNRFGSHEWFAHRGISHTPLFAAVLAAAMVWLAMPSAGRGMRARLWFAFFLATASHGFLDALSAYGPGIPFLFPFSDQRYFLPWRPIRADPHGPGLLSVLLRSIRTELVWIWLPGSILLALTVMWRRRRLRAALVITLVVAGVSQANGQAQARASDSVEVRAVATGIVAADNARDLAAVLAYYAPSAILLPPNESPVVGHSSIRPRYEALFRDYAPAIEGRIDEMVLEPNWACVRGHNGGWLRGRAGRPDKALDDVYLMILGRKDGVWRITTLMWHRASP